MSEKTATFTATIDGIGVTDNEPMPGIGTVKGNFTRYITREDDDWDSFHDFLRLISNNRRRVSITVLDEDDEREDH